MKITTLKTPVSIEFHPDQYWLKKSDNEFNGDYMLVYQIDMSYAGKPNQEGAPVLYMTEQQAEIFIKAGFDEIYGD